MSDIVCVTNRKLCGDNFIERIEAIAKASPQGIILREKDLSETEYKMLAKEVMAVCEKYQIPCILHSFIHIAMELGNPSIHLPLPQLRSMTSEEKEQFSHIGASCHSVEEAREAEALGCTYIIAGHIFATDCKKGIPPRGIEFLEKVCQAVTIPVYAIGGINECNIAKVRKVGAAGACVMSGFMQCTIPETYMKRFIRPNDVKVRKSGSLKTIIYKKELEEDKMQFRKEQLLLYAVTDRAWVGKQTLYQQIESALKGGVTMVQLREKSIEEKEFIEEAREIRALCHQYNAPLIINDNLKVALESGADGIHVGQEDMPVAQIRKIAGTDFIIGATAKTIEQAKKAEAEGADYLGVGAVFPSPTKKNAIRVTKEQLKEICASVSIPAVAIGGVDRNNFLSLKGCGISGIAVVSAIFSAEDICQAAEELREGVTDITKQYYVN